MAKLKTELLAPARDKKTAFVAINAGADAIYMGAKSFGARQNAGNSIEDIKSVVDFAHKFYVKVFVTINTILSDEELLESQELIKKLYEIGVDAIIVQDMGILKLAIDKKIPPIPIHMSTQCDNRTLEKVKFFEEMGLPRVILARELSLDKIKQILKECSGVEIETFIHGALCVSYSGQCYLSQYIGGRSANRGECAQPCRKLYSLCNDKGEVLVKNKHLLSLKDFNASQCVEELVKIGVKSFKIEGRLKDENYVKNVVLNYRKLLDKYSKKSSSGVVVTDFEPNVDKTFNRGYTTYFLKGREKCFNFASPKSIGQEVGVLKKSSGKFYVLTTKEKISPQDGMCYFTSAGELKGFAVNKVDGDKIYPNTYVDILAGTKIYRNQDVIFEKELLNAKVARKIRVDLSVKNGVLRLVDENYNKLEKMLPKGEAPLNQSKANETFMKQIQKVGESDFMIVSAKLEDDVEFYPVSTINDFRRACFEELMSIRLKNYRRKFQKDINYVPYHKDILDYRANVFNNEALEFYRESLCEVSELAFEKSVPEREAVELMRTKHCIKWAINKCKAPDQLFLVDEKGVKFPLKFDCSNCEMIVLKP